MQHPIHNLPDGNHARSEHAKAHHHASLSAGSWKPREGDHSERVDARVLKEIDRIGQESGRADPQANPALDKEHCSIERRANDKRASITRIKVS